VVEFEMPSAHKGQRLYWDRGPLARRERETRDKGGTRFSARAYSAGETPAVPVKQIRLTCKGE